MPPEGQETFEIQALLTELHVYPLGQRESDITISHLSVTVFINPLFEHAASWTHTSRSSTYVKPVLHEI
jgi:hypothetical protein